MSKWKFVIVSKDKNFKMPPEKFTELVGLADLNMSYIDSNTKPLAEVYNEYLDVERQWHSSSFDYMVFMHADVAFNLESFIKHVESVAGKYDIIGLCGTSVMNVSQSPLNWYTSSSPTPQNRWGCVIHGELNNRMAWFSEHSPDVGDHEVACIDGLCIIFTKTAIADNSIRFDPSVGSFDFYDTDISMQAMMKGLKLGVVVRKDLMHYSVGRSILTDEFLKNEVKFRNKWNLPIPENSPIRKKGLLDVAETNSLSTGISSDLNAEVSAIKQEELAKTPEDQTPAE